MAKTLTKKQNIKKWKKGINNNKIANSDSYSRNVRGGIRLTGTN